MATAVWFHDHDVAAVATDTLVLEVYPCESEDLYLPVHLLHLVEMGMTQGQNWFLDELGRRVRRRRPVRVPARRHPAPLHQRPGIAGQPDRPALSAAPTQCAPLRGYRSAPPGLEAGLGLTPP